MELVQCPWLKLKEKMTLCAQYCSEQKLAWIQQLRRGRVGGARGVA